MWDLFINPFEITAVLTGLASVYFSYRKNILTYFFGIISVLLYVYLCYNSGLYAEAGINVFYFIMSVYGWIKWRQLYAKNERFKAISLKYSYQWIFVLLTAFFWGIIYLILAEFTDSNVPLADSFTTSFFITGMILMTFKSIENWIYLFIGNIFSIPLFMFKELYVSSFFYLILCVFSIMGYLNWKKSLKSD